MADRTIRVLIFDLDGTLADTLPLCIEAFRRAVEPACGRRLDDGDIISTFGPSEEGTIAVLAPGHYDECLENYLHHYDALHGMCPALFDGMRELLDRLKACGVTVALVTGKGPRSCVISLRRFGLSDFFDHVGCGSPEGDVKSRRITEVLEKYRVQPCEALYVGDSPSDITACRRAGVPVASAAWAASADPARLAAMGPDEIFFTVADFAEYIYRYACGPQAADGAQMPTRHSTQLLN